MASRRRPSSASSRFSSSAAALLADVEMLGDKILQLRFQFRALIGRCPAILHGQMARLVFEVHIGLKQLEHLGVVLFQRVPAEIDHISRPVHARSLAAPDCDHASPHAWTARHHAWTVGPHARTAGRRPLAVFRVGRALSRSTRRTHPRLATVRRTIAVVRPRRTPPRPTACRSRSHGTIAVGRPRIVGPLLFRYLFPLRAIILARSDPGEQKP